jgi:hypothetical protein
MGTTSQPTKVRPVRSHRVNRRTERRAALGPPGECKSAAIRRPRNVKVDVRAPRQATRIRSVRAHHPEGNPRYCSLPVARKCEPLACRRPRGCNSIPQSVTVASVGAHGEDPVVLVSDPSVAAHEGAIGTRNQADRENNEREDKNRAAKRLRHLPNRILFVDSPLRLRHPNRLCALFQDRAQGRFWLERVVWRKLPRPARVSLVSKPRSSGEFHPLRRCQFHRRRRESRRPRIPGGDHHPPSPRCGRRRRHH